jgi:hypothetical protein
MGREIESRQNAGKRRQRSPLKIKIFYFNAEGHVLHLGVEAHAEGLEHGPLNGQRAEEQEPTKPQVRPADRRNRFESRQGEHQGQRQRVLSAFEVNENQVSNPLISEVQTMTFKNYVHAMSI